MAKFDKIAVLNKIGSTGMVPVFYHEDGGTAIMDIIDGHVLAGTSRFINACLLIICIAIGLSMTLLITGISTL